MPVDTWSRTEETWRRWTSLRDRGWRQAAEIVRERLDDDLAHLLHHLGILRRAVLEPTGDGFVSPVASILAELQALDDEFCEVIINRRVNMITVITEPIALEGVELGPFAIELPWSKIGDSWAYRVIAQEPNVAVTNDSATHPHVSSGLLCEGMASESIRRALREGRLFDFFLIVRQVLRTYNPESAYVPLDEWFGPACHDCGRCTGDDRTPCGSCDVPLCDGCARSCRECGQHLCAQCVDGCPHCEESLCSRCLQPCPSCQQPSCLECLHENQHCPSCMEKHHDDEANPSLDADGVGEDPNAA